MNNKKLIIIRYFILATLIFSIVGYKENVDVYNVISVLNFSQCFTKRNKI